MLHTRATGLRRRIYFTIHFNIVFELVTYVDCTITQPLIHSWIVPEKTIYTVYWIYCTSPCCQIEANWQHRFTLYISFRIISDGTKIIRYNMTAMGGHRWRPPHRSAIAPQRTSTCGLAHWSRHHQTITMVPSSPRRMRGRGKTWLTEA
jgi:hypothetical protein